jgi:hypothetical protein
MTTAQHEAQQKRMADRPLPWHVERGVYVGTDYPRITVHAANGAYVCEMSLISRHNPYDVEAAAERAQRICDWAAAAERER